MLIDFNVDLELYKVFYITAVLGSMTKAAENLYIGQPAISKAIKAIEEKLGVELFVRRSKGLVLTNEGIVLFEHISQAMELIKKAEDHILNFKSQSSKSVKIEICAMQYKLLILPHLKSFFENCNKNAIDISPTTDSYSSLGLLEEGQIDCCIMTRPIDSDNFKFIKLYTFHDYLMGSSEYIKSIIAAGQDPIKDATLISVMNGSILGCYEKLRLRNINFKSKMKVTSMEHTISLTKLGYGLGFIAEELVQDELSSKDLVKVEIYYPRHKRDVGFLLNRNAKEKDVLRKFIDYYCNLYTGFEDEPAKAERF